MSRPTRRDEAWHAALVTATETGLDDTFGVDDVVETADDLGLDVARRTIRKTARVMVDFGYIRERDAGQYHLSEIVVDAIGSHRGLDEVLDR